MHRRQVGIFLKRRVQSRLRLFRPLCVDIKLATRSVGLGGRENAAGITLRVDVQGDFEGAHVKAILAGVGIHRSGKLLEIAESFLRSLDLIATGVPMVAKKFERRLRFARIGIEHQVVHHGPRLRIENRSAILLVVVRRVVLDLKKRLLDRDQPVLLQNL